MADFLGKRGARVGVDFVFLDLVLSTGVAGNREQDRLLEARPVVPSMPRQRTPPLPGRAAATPGTSGLQSVRVKTCDAVHACNNFYAH